MVKKEVSCLAGSLPGTIPKIRHNAHNSILLLVRASDVKKVIFGTNIRVCIKVWPH